MGKTPPRMHPHPDHRPEDGDLREVVLVGDVGGTNARLALASSEGLVGDVAYLRTGGFPSLAEAIRWFLADRASGLRLRGAAICGAGPVVATPTGPCIHMTNATWEVSAAEIRAATGVERPVVMNDFAALARGVLLLSPDLLQPLGGGRPVPQGPVAVLGPGTGLGAAALVPDRSGRYVVLATEGGHADLAPSDPRDLRVLECLFRRFGGHISAERVLSGAGLSNLYRTAAELAGECHEDEVEPAAVLDRARAGSDRHAVAAVEMFTGWLGSFAGNLALTYGATGGVFVAGGVTPRLGSLFDEALFRRRFAEKGRLRSFLEPIPVWLVLGGEPALEGLGAEAFVGDGEPLPPAGAAAHRALESRTVGGRAHAGSELASAARRG